jgi:hypothetical protein
MFNANREPLRRTRRARWLPTGPAIANPTDSADTLRSEVGQVRTDGWRGGGSAVSRTIEGACAAIVAAHNREGQPNPVANETVQAVRRGIRPPPASKHATTAVLAGVDLGRIAAETHHAQSPLSSSTTSDDRKPSSSPPGATAESEPTVR